MEQFANEGRPRRREHSRDFKTRILAQCAQPGARVAGVALSHGLHAKMVPRWIREERLRGESAGLVWSLAAPAFVAVPLAPDVVSVIEQPAAREVKLHRLRTEMLNPSLKSTRYGMHYCSGPEKFYCSGPEKF